MKLNFASNKHRELQRNSVARNKAVPNRKARTKHPLSTYTEDEKRWLVTTADKELNKDTVFMLILKLMWDDKILTKRHISKHNQRDNVARFKIKLDMNVGC